MTADDFNALTTTRYGPMLYNRFDRYVGHSLERYGECCEFEIDLLRQLCPVGGIFLDVGANIGTHTVALAKHVGRAGFVYAFEPQRIVFQALAANVALQSLANVQCVEAAVGSSHDELSIPDINYAVATNFGGISPRQFDRGRPVRQVRLDDYAWIGRVDLIKIDVEGMEQEVILGAQTMIERQRPVLYVENDRIDRSESLIRQIDNLGYRLYWHLAPLFNPGNFRGETANDFNGIAASNMLGIPRERPIAVEGLVEITDFAYHPFRRTE